MTGTKTSQKKAEAMRRDECITRLRDALPAGSCIYVQAVHKSARVLMIANQVKGQPFIMDITPQVAFILGYRQTRDGMSLRQTYASQIASELAGRIHQDSRALTFQRI